MNLLAMFGSWYKNRIRHHEESLRQVLLFDGAIVPRLSRTAKGIEPLLTLPNRPLTTRMTV
jgi:hypothetical protein